MEFSEAIKRVIKESGMTQQRLADLLGMKSQSVIGQRLRRGNMKVSSLLQILDAIGYELIIQPKKPGRRATGQILIDRVAEEDPNKSEA